MVVRVKAQRLRIEGDGSTSIQVADGSVFDSATDTHTQCCVFTSKFQTAPQMASAEVQSLTAGRSSRPTRHLPGATAETTQLRSCCGTRCAGHVTS